MLSEAVSHKNSQFYLENIIPLASYFYLAVTYIGKQVWLWETDLATLNIDIHLLA